MRNFWIVGVVAALGLLLVGCDGDVQSGVTSSPPVSVHGYWVPTSVNNAGSAILTDCTGDFTALEGLTSADAMIGNDCVAGGWQRTSQAISTYTHQPLQYSCTDGDHGYRGGGGTVSGNSLAGQMDQKSWGQGHAGYAYINGVKSGDTTLNLVEYKISSEGSIVGSCSIDPPLSISVEIMLQPPSATTTNPGIELGPLTATDLIRALKSR